ncbi:hypothetical protein [Brevundimonas sp.]|uniref:hypothetical protein n=1 Tax=Brevundimonas sp. TaxID=1871086 RepID=UPI00289C4082|nr:hypothetical protein [Brevundimonas sp.]
MIRGSGDIAPPCTYAEWSEFFNRFLSPDCDDLRLITLAGQGQVTWSAGLAENFGQRAVETLTSRLNAIGERLQQHLQRARTDADLLRAIMEVRRGLSTMRQFAQIPAFPEVLRESLTEIVDHHARERQKSLLESGARDRTGRLTSLLRGNPLDRQDEPAPTPGAPPIDMVPQRLRTPLGGTVRRILL